MATERNLDLTFVHTASELGDFAATWLPRLVVVVRGTTGRLDLAQPALKDRVRFGSRGVCLGAPTTEPAKEGEQKMSWRFIAPEEVTALIEAIEPLAGKPEVKGIADTGSWHQSITVSGAVGELTFHTRVGLMQSGYRGSHAAAFATLVRRVLMVANLDVEDPLWGTLLIAK